MKGIVTNISIIIPVYNSENQIEKCLDSIFSQDFSGVFEVIAVDDGSCDKSIEILKKYQENDPRLKIIEHGINRKLSVTRATGMKASCGDYIMHVDQDDWLLPGAIESIYAKCLETGADVLVYNYIKETSKGKKKVIRNIKKQIITTDKFETLRHFLGATWNKIVKRSFIENLLSGQVGVNNTEDLLYGIEILFKVEKICLIPEHYYTYYTNSNSMTHTTNIEQYLLSQFVILNQIQKIFLKYNVNSKLCTKILNYFEKWIYMEFAKTHLNHIQDLEVCNSLISEFSKFSMMNQVRIKHLELSLNNKFICYLELTKRFGFRMTIGIVLSNLNNHRK